jgi:phage tail-like protein
LPAVFLAEPTSADFTERFLTLFDTTLRGIERGIDTQARLFDPLSAPATSGAQGTPDFLSWLASWIGIGFERQWDTAKRRRFLKAAGRLFDRRGTFEGLRQQLLMLLDFDRVPSCCTFEEASRSCRCAPANCAPRPKAPAWQPPALILEHFRLRRWLYVGAGRLGEQAMLWGSKIAGRSQLDQNAQLDHTRLLAVPDPLHDPFRVYAHQFTVFVPSRYRDSEKARKALDNLLRSESPAPLRFNVNFVEPRFRIGVQSMIGFDSVIGRLPEGVALGGTALGSSVLTAPPHLQGGPSIALDKEGRIGTTTLLN